MSEKRSNLVIVSTLQGSGATLFRCGGIFDYYFITNLQPHLF